MGNMKQENKPTMTGVMQQEDVRIRDDKDSATLDEEDDDRIVKKLLVQVGARNIPSTASEITKTKEGSHGGKNEVHKRKKCNLEGSIAVAGVCVAWSIATCVRAI